jgi:hypothetical protein
VEALDVLKPFLRHFLALASCPLVAPEHITLPIDPWMPDIEPPQGLLLVSSSEALVVGTHIQ